MDAHANRMRSCLLPPASCLLSSFSACPSTVVLTRPAVIAAR